MKNTDCNLSSDQFTFIYKTHREWVKNMASRYVDCPYTAEDIAQEVFSRIWQRKRSLPPISSIDLFLATTTRNCAINFLRRQQTRKVGHEQYASMARPRLIIEDAVLEREYQRWLDEAVARLSQRQQQAFILGRGLGLRIKEVATVMNISNSTAKVHVRSAVRAVKEAINLRLAG